MTLPVGSFDPDDLPEGVYKPSELGEVLQDQSKDKYKAQAASRFPSVVSGTSAGSPANVGGPLGFVVDLAANFTKNVATADPATIKKPGDLMPLANPFLNDLPVVEAFADLLAALSGTYTGDDPVLSAIADMNIGGALTAIIAGIFNGWFGGGSVGDPLEVQYTIEAIKDAILNGYMVHTATTNETYTLPADLTEVTAILIGGGENGENGKDMSSGTRTLGGRGGGFISEPLDAAALAGETLTITVGPTGGTSSVSHGATVLASCAAGASGGISTGIFGYSPTTSTPGDGGGGGWGVTSGPIEGGSGLAGDASAKAPGGAGGVYIPRNESGPPGDAGGNANPAATTKCAGGGGGGGAGGGYNTIGGGGRNGGAGGPGGYPGGGGGGGGGRGRGSINGSHGAGGIGAPGIVWIVHK